MDFLELLENELEKLDQLNEIAFKKKVVFRKGKRIKKKTCPPGYRLVGNRCVRQKASERLKRSRGARRGNRRSKAARLRTRKRTLIKRSRFFKPKKRK